MEYSFPTRKSLTLGIIIWGVMLGTLGLTVYYLLEDINATTISIVTVVNVPTIIVMYVIWFRTSYHVKLLSDCENWILYRT